MAKVTHEDISKLNFLTVGPRNELIAAICDDSETPPQIVMNLQNLEEKKFVNLIIAAPQMYKALTSMFNILQIQIDQLECMEGCEDFAKVFYDTQNEILMIQRIAREGLEKVAKDVAKENKKL